MENLMNHKQISHLKKTYKGERIFLAKENSYSFDLLSDTWTLGYKKNPIKLDWMNEANLDDATFIDIRLHLAHIAKHVAAQTAYSSSLTIKNHIVKNLDVASFEAHWLTMTHSRKKAIKSAINQGYEFCEKDYKSETFHHLYEFVNKCEIKKSRSFNPLDSRKGAYSEIELDNIQEGLRIETLKVFAVTPKGIYDFIQHRKLIASQLMISTNRRPTQLRQIKWCDILPIGTKFITPKKINRDWEPLTQHLFSDVEQLHLRTFKGKDGRFRYNAESRSHRLEPKCSQLILRYFKLYQNYLTQLLNNKGLILHDDEIRELMMRLPVLPDSSLFDVDFDSKAALFNAVSITSEGFHIRADRLGQSIDSVFINEIKPVSDRHPTGHLKLGNNRWRHTQITNGYRLGLPPSAIAAITGVTVNTTKAYADFKVSERVRADQAYAGNEIVKRFDSISVTDLKKRPEFSVKDEFEEEMGFKLNPANCSTCDSKGGAPMACYPCHNFRPHEKANHQKYLDKAEAKLQKNITKGHPATTKKLKNIILYIKVTIAECNERATVKLAGE